MDKKFKVLLFTRQLTIGGQEHQLVEFAKRIDRSIFEPTVFCLTDSSGKENVISELKDADVNINSMYKRIKFDPIL